MINKRAVSISKILYAYMWAKPYDNSNVKSIDPKLKKQWRYSPLFLDPIAETSIELTGRRSMDYRLAEDKCGFKHESGKTAWHHVWEKNNGKYRMQLVELSIHQKTCPHAGGCKLWTIINHKTKYSYKRRGNPVRQYVDYEMDYKIGDDCRFIFEKLFNNKMKRNIKAQKMRILGIDAYVYSALCNPSARKN